MSMKNPSTTVTEEQLAKAMLRNVLSKAGPLDMSAVPAPMRGFVEKMMGGLNPQQFLYAMIDHAGPEMVESVIQGAYDLVASIEQLNEEA